MKNVNKRDLKSPESTVESTTRNSDSFISSGEDFKQALALYAEESKQETISVSEEEKKLQTVVKHVQVAAESQDPSHVGFKLASVEGELDDEESSSEEGEESDSSTGVTRPLGGALTGVGTLLLMNSIFNEEAKYKKITVMLDGKVTPVYSNGRNLYVPDPDFGSRWVSQVHGRYQVIHMPDSKPVYVDLDGPYLEGEGARPYVELDQEKGVAKSFKVDDQYVQSFYGAFFTIKNGERLHIEIKGGVAKSFKVGDQPILSRAGVPVIEQDGRAVRVAINFDDNSAKILTVGQQNVLINRYGHTYLIDANGKSLHVEVQNGVAKTFQIEQDGKTVDVEIDRRGRHLDLDFDFESGKATEAAVAQMYPIARFNEADADGKMSYQKLDQHDQIYQKHTVNQGSDELYSKNSNFKRFAPAALLIGVGLGTLFVGEVASLTGKSKPQLQIKSPALKKLLQKTAKILHAVSQKQPALPAAR